MGVKKSNQLILGRRNFILTALISPILISMVFDRQKNKLTHSPLINQDEGFVVLDGWVMLKDELIESRG
jgi:hypothetical protein